jgi:cellulose synthase/poly-beta-1,6-N-acetylglucosamine synthase-like glycosyltransferase
VADDGSGPEIEALFKAFADSVSFPCTFLWQEDAGWGKLRMLNWATVEALADRIVFTDGDCVPHGHFVDSYLSDFSDEAGHCGRRVDLMEKLGPSVTADDVRAGRLDDPLWLARRIRAGEIDYGAQGFRLPRVLAGLIRTFSAKPTILGSNFGIHRKLLEKINGFDESFKSPGLGEDTDIERRLRLAGIPLRWITYRAIQHHLWHPLTKVGEQSRLMLALRAQSNSREAVQGLRELKKILP